jgi:MoaA/NifB/PqqE/SkfB family radical SAM enzyme
METPSKEVKKHIKQFADLGTINMDFTGGEPLLRKELADFYAYAKDYGMFVTLNTNGWYVRKRINEIAPYLDNAQVSIDSHIPKENDRIRGVRGAYERCIDALKLFKKHSVPVTGVCTLTHQTLGRLKGLSKLGQELGVDINVNIVFPAPLEHSTDETKVTTKMIIDYKKCAKHLRLARKLPRLIISEYMIKLLERGGNRKDRPVCRASSVMATVSADGKMILPCLYHPETHLDLRNEYQYVRDAWNSDSAWRVRTNCGRYPYCDGCIIRCYIETSEVGMPRNFSSFFLLARDYLPLFLNRARG